MVRYFIKRRDFLKTAGIGAFGAVVGCKSAPPPKSPTSASSPMPPTPKVESQSQETIPDAPPESACAIETSPMIETPSITVPVQNGGAGSRPNVLLITTDDLHYDSVGAFGCPIPGITPHIDRLAEEGVRFEHAHVNIAVCQPCRGTLATGLYPHRSGIEGFEHAMNRMPTVMQTLKDAGYLTGILSKVIHSTPHGGFRWDMAVGTRDTCNGRDPSRYFSHTARFIRRSQKEDKPFYLMVNSQDPHRLFSGAQKERIKFKACAHPNPSRRFSPEEIVVPGFLPDLPDVRKETAQYFGSVRRADDTVGEVLRALEASGEARNTIVVFISDHGMSMPFSKGNCYPFSTRVPWIVRWPGVAAPGRVDRDHFISSIDFFPTVLEALGLPIPEGLDGRSFLPLLWGEPGDGRDKVFTQFYRTVRNDEYPMRAVQDIRFSYIFNPWSDGKRPYRAEPLESLSFKAMKAAARNDEFMRERVAMCLYREKEELYDLSSDPHCLHNLVDDASFRDDLERMRGTLRTWMADTGDRAFSCFEHMDDQKICEQLFTHKANRISQIEDED